MIYTEDGIFSVYLELNELSYTISLSRYLGLTYTETLIPIVQNSRYTKFQLNAFDNLPSGQYNLQILSGETLIYQEDMQIKRDVVTYTLPSSVVNWDAPTYIKTTRSFSSGFSNGFN